MSNWLEKMRLASQKWELQETIHVQRKNPSVAKAGRLTSTMEGTGRICVLQIQGVWFMATFLFPPGIKLLISEFYWSTNPPPNPWFPFCFSKAQERPLWVWTRDYFNLFYSDPLRNQISENISITFIPLWPFIPNNKVQELRLICLPNKLRMAFHKTKKEGVLGEAGRGGNAYVVQWLKEFLRMFASCNRKPPHECLHSVSCLIDQLIYCLPLLYTNLARL